VLIDGPVTNCSGQPFENWLEAVCSVSPQRMQIYSTDRPVPEAEVRRVPVEELQRIAGEVSRRTGIQVEAFWEGGSASFKP